MNKERITTIAALLKSMAHPIRLEILCRLREGECTVAELQASIQTSDGNLSQHLAVLRNQGLITCRREGNFLYNRISDPRSNELMHCLQHLYCPDGGNTPPAAD